MLLIFVKVLGKNGLILSLHAKGKKRSHYYIFLVNSQMSWDQTKLLRQKLKQGVERAEEDTMDPSVLFPTPNPEDSSLCTSGSSSSQCEPDKSVPGTFFLSERWKPASIRNLLIFNQSRKPDLSIRFEGNILPQKNKKEAESSKAEIWDPFFNCLPFIKPHFLY